MNETPTPPEGYKLIIDQANGPVTLVEGDALFDFYYPQKGWIIITRDTKLFPKARISVAVPIGRATTYSSGAPVPPEGYELATPNIGTCTHNWKCLVGLGSKHVWVSTEEAKQNGWEPALFCQPVQSCTQAPQESILQEAERLVNGDRQQSYGDASESFERIADFWHAYLKTKLKGDAHISAKDVAAMMILLKISRSVTCNKRDNWVDIAGYAELGSKLED